MWRMRLSLESNGAGAETGVFRMTWPLDNIVRTAVTAARRHLGTWPTNMRKISNRRMRARLQPAPRYITA
jgi:hypothetical protein